MKSYSNKAVGLLSTIAASVLLLAALSMKANVHATQVQPMTNGNMQVAYWGGPFFWSPVYWNRPAYPAYGTNYMTGPGCCQRNVYWTGWQDFRPACQKSCLVNRWDGSTVRCVKRCR